MMVGSTLVFWILKSFEASAGLYPDPVVSGDTTADGEHCLALRVRRGSLHELNIGVSVAESVGVDGAHTAITRARDILQQWSNLETLRGLGYRHIRVGETTKQIVGIPLGCVDRIIVEVIAENRRSESTWKIK